jgi:hypothetical protein
MTNTDRAEWEAAAKEAFTAQDVLRDYATQSRRERQPLLMSADDAAFSAELLGRLATLIEHQGREIERLRPSVVDADSYCSLLAYRFGARLPDDLVEDLKAASQRARKALTRTPPQEEQSDR